MLFRGSTRESSYSKDAEACFPLARTASKANLVPRHCSRKPTSQVDDIIATSALRTTLQPMRRTGPWVFEPIHWLPHLKLLFMGLSVFSSAAPYGRSYARVFT